MKGSLFFFILLTTNTLFAKESYQHLQEQIQSLEAQLKLLKTEVERQKIASQKLAEVDLKPGLKVTSPNKRHNFSVGGRVMFDVHNISPESSLSEALGLSGKDGVQFRRTRMFIKGTLNEKLHYQWQYDFSKAGIGQTKATYLKYKANDGRSLWAGNIKEPFGLEEVNSSKHETFMEESAATLAFTPNYNPGFLYRKEDPVDDLAWEVGVFRTDEGSFGRSPNTTGVNLGDWNYTGRLTYVANYDELRDQVLHLGFAYSYRNLNGDHIRYDSKVENIYHNVSLVDTGLIAAESANQFGYEVAWVNGPLSLQSELFDIRVDPSGFQSKATFGGHYLMASYFLTGESRPYNRIYRYFGRLKPKTSYFSGGRGAWELTARYSSVELNDIGTGILGGEAESTTLGVNWYMDSRTRLMLNWINTEVISGVDVNLGKTESISMRFQVDF